MVKKSTQINLGFKQKLKSKKNRTLSSQLWLKRHLNDSYVQLAKENGYYSRAAYKLVEINDKYKIFKSNQVVIDLGAAPGGWSQVASKIIFTKKSISSKLISIDLLPIKEIENANLLQGDFTDINMINNIKELMGNNLANVVMSDMSPNTSGSKSLDHIKIMNLVEIAFDFAQGVLNENGVFIAKVFQGGTQSDLLTKIKKCFRYVDHFKPPASRKESKEIYLIARGYKAIN